MKTFKRKLAPSLALFVFLSVSQLASAFYDPSLGRWLNRDPIGEYGGINLYGFVANRPTTYVDLLGLEVKGVFDTSTGLLTIADTATHETVSVPAESGGSYYGGTYQGDPLPNGTYDILSQQARPNFYRLEPVDEPYGDDMHNATGRNRFRLHLPGRTVGCIAVKSPTDWKKVEDLIKKSFMSELPPPTKTVPSQSRNPFAPPTEMLNFYGTINVIDSDRRKPKKL